jgi:hypothetical protein
MILEAARLRRAVTAAPVKKNRRKVASSPAKNSSD